MILKLKSLSESYLTRIRNAITWLIEGRATYLVALFAFQPETFRLTKCNHLLTVV